MPLRVLEPVDLRNVRMIEGRERLRFALETGVPLGDRPRTRAARSFTATSRFSFVSRAL